MRDTRTAAVFSVIPSGRSVGPNEPLAFVPFARPMVWGGRRLERLLGKELPGPGGYGETWELSAHPLHRSRVDAGPSRGQTLDELAARWPRELFGDVPPEGGRFPWLIKFLDCHERLSVQVHPCDALAASLTADTTGKTEAFVVLHAEPGAVVYAGLADGVGRDDLEHHAAAGTLEQCLHSFAPGVGDCVFLPAGTVHATGGGLVLAEVQQTSDATLRLFDWHRVGPDGQPRQLHVREALEAIDWTNCGPVRPVLPTPLPNGGERLVDCPQFVLERFRVGRPVPTPAGRLSAWVVLEGSAEIVTAAGYRRMFTRGQTVLVPAAARGVMWQVAGGAEAATLLCVRQSVG